MPTHAKTLLAGTTTAILLFAASSGADTTDIDNDQTLNGGIFLADNNVTVGEVEEVAGLAIAQGNTLSVDYETGSVNVSNNQTVDVSGHGESIVNVDIASTSASSSATTLGNSATITTCCGNIDNISSQTVESGHTMSAVANLNVSNWAMNANTSALATGNAISTQTWYGTALNSTIDQTNRATITSESFIDGGGLLADSAVVASTAIANTGFAGGESTTTIVGVTQNSHGPLVQATGGILSPDVEDTVIATTATGNNFTIENSFGYVQSDVDQDNVAYVRAQTDVDVGIWSNQNSASSYAVGNSNLTSNIGSDIYIDNVQLNAGGGVEAVTNWTGATSGGVGGFDQQVVSSSAIGNAVSGYVCGTCGVGGITAVNHQNNSATVTATTSANSGDGGTVIGTATAVGNSATFHSTGG